MIEIAHYSNYMSAADIATIALCLINWIFVSTTYTKKQQNLSLFHMANGMVWMAAIMSLIFFALMKKDIGFPNIALYFIHALIYIFLGLTYVAYFLYLANTIGFTSKQKRFLLLFVGIPFLIFTVAELLAPVTNMGCCVARDLRIAQKGMPEPFKLLYLFDSVTMGVFLFRNRNKFVTKMLNCILYTTAISYFIVIFQSFFQQNSFTCLTFIFPIESVLFLFHYSSFDISTGSLDAQAFAGYLEDNDGEELSLVFLALEKFDTSMISSDLSEHFYHFNEQYFVGCTTFRVKANQLCLVFKDKKNPHRQQKVEEMLQDFRNLYGKYHLDYKIVIMHSDARIHGSRAFVQICEYLQSKMQMNTILYCKDEDLDRYFYNAGIVDGLMDISRDNNLDDPRVRVFCQPVLDTKTKKYRTAEALMRLDLGGGKMVFPDLFIPLAEQFDLIHALSMIILNKTCRIIHQLLEEHYEIDRVSVNFSIAEIKKPYFCDDIINIIKQNEIPFEKIAVELTESTKDTDYVHMKNVVNTLKSYGIKIYLDDFGIGYSNTSRILEVPFDVIKFDRSLTIASGKSETSKYMVQQFAGIFKRTEYQVLFEGIENTEDEQRCIDMQADMLQGYAYSKPIPMEELKSFLVRK